MKKPQNPDDLWVIHCEKIHTKADGICDMYAILDAITGHCMAMKILAGHPTPEDTRALLEEAVAKFGNPPQKMAISEEGNVADFFAAACTEFDISFETLSKEQIAPYVADFAMSFRSFSQKG